MWGPECVPSSRTSMRWGSTLLFIPHKDTLQSKPGNCVRARKPQQSQSPEIAPRWGGTLRTPLLRQTTQRRPADMTQNLLQDLCPSELMGSTVVELNTAGIPHVLEFNTTCLALHVWAFAPSLRASLKAVTENMTFQKVKGTRECGSNHHSFHLFRRLCQAYKKPIKHEGWLHFWKE